jgi:hypothetical protein
MSASRQKRPKYESSRNDAMGPRGDITTIHSITWSAQASNKSAMIGRPRKSGLSVHPDNQTNFIHSATEFSDADRPLD